MSLYIPYYFSNLNLRDSLKTFVEYHHQMNRYRKLHQKWYDLHRKMINLTVVDGVTNILKKHQPPEQATQAANASNAAANQAPVRQRQPQTRMHRGRDNVVRRISYLKISVFI